MILFLMPRKCYSLYLYQPMDQNLKIVVNTQHMCNLFLLIHPLFVNLSSLKYLFIIPESIFAKLWQLPKDMYRIEMCKYQAKFYKAKISLILSFSNCKLISCL